jgi:transcriptional regulator NrdR family protein
MQCESCGEYCHRVQRTFKDIKTGTIMRVRLCLCCGHLWITEEKITILDPKTTKNIPETTKN